MDSNLLVNGDIKLGREFVDIVTRSRRVRLEAAFWWREEDDWRFVTATPVVHQHGRLEAHRRIEQALGTQKERFRHILDKLDALSPSEGLIAVLDIGSIGAVPLNRPVRDEKVGSAFVSAAYFYVFAPATFAAA